MLGPFVGATEIICGIAVLPGVWLRVAFSRFSPSFQSRL